MRIYPEKLASHLSKNLLPIYCISGDEPLLVQECSDLVRTAARNAGCNEREIIDSGVTRFNWESIIQSANSLSLFSERRLIELLLPSGKPGAEGSKALCNYIETSSSEDVFLIVSGKIEKASTNSKWYQKVDSAGATIQVWPVSDKDMPRWLSYRAKVAGLSIDSDAIDLLAEKVQGNLLCAVQEISKLKMISDKDGHVTRQVVIESVLNNARYSLFGMIDCALEGNTALAIRTLRGLGAEGVEPILILWALSRECRLLRNLKIDLKNGKKVSDALNDYNIWKSRAPLVQHALDHHTIQSLETLLSYAGEVDSAIKGLSLINPWLRIEDMVVSLSQPQKPSIRIIR